MNPNPNPNPSAPMYTQLCVISAFVRSWSGKKQGCLIDSFKEEPFMILTRISPLFVKRGVPSGTLTVVYDSC